MVGYAIWKYELAITDYQTISMPEQALILSIQSQNGVLCLWALLSPTGNKVDRQFEVFGTGHLIPIGMSINREYLASVQQGVFVWHVFERIN